MHIKLKYKDPDNDEELAILAKMKIGDFLLIKSEVMQCFKPGKCKEHKGLLSVSSVPGQSTKFIIQLPFNRTNNEPYTDN